MADTPWDAIIVGQGLAGTTLAWCLLDAGQRVLIIDACEPVTSSKIAAGLITPITGQRMAVDSRWEEFFPAARGFYKRIEKRTGQNFFHERTAVRLFKSDAERQNWSQRERQPSFQTHLVDPAPAELFAPELGDASGGGFVMKAAQLDVADFLEASRELLEFERMTLDWHCDVTTGSEEISVGGHVTRMLISCEGYAAVRNPYFSYVPFVAAKGDILTVRFHHPMPPVSLHCGIWVAPTNDAHVFRVGSTYDRENLDNVPCPNARADIECKLQNFIRVPYTVLDHLAAVRPIIHESKPLVGLHRAHDRLGYFNGLGSKGSLLAPWFAQRLSDFLVLDTPLPEAIDLRKKF